jgi:ubiquinone biosynthesis protein UbiJ
MVEQIFLAALNHLLGGANWARARLMPYAGRAARIEMPPFTFAFVIDAEGLARPEPDPGTCDVLIRLPADTPLLLPRGLDKVMAAASVDGNAEFATELSFVFRQLRWDAEEDLSRLVGDVAAHRLVGTASRFFDWQNQAAQNFAANLAEYLTQESRLIVAAEEFATWREAVNRLEADLNRFEGRLGRLGG